MIKKILKHLLIPSICASAAVNAANSGDRLGCIQSLSKRVVYDNAVQTLILSSCQLQDQDIPAVVNFLNSRSDVHEVDLDHNNLTDVSLYALSTIPSILNFVGGHNNFTDVGVQQLVNNKNLESVFLDSNQITDKGAALFVTLPNLRLLSLADNDITDMGAAAIAENTSLNDVFLDNNNIGPRGAKALAASKAKYLIGISLNNNHIGDEGAKALLEKPGFGFRLLLAGNHITDDSALSIYKTHSSWIDLSHNELTDKGVKIIINDPNPIPLDYLDLDYNQLTKVGIDALANSNIPYSAYGNNEEDATTKQTQQLAKLRLLKTKCDTTNVRTCALLNRKNIQN